MALEWSTVKLLDSKGLFPAGRALLDIGSSNVYNADGPGVADFVRTRAPDAASSDSFAADIAARSRLLVDGQQQNKAFLGEILTTAGLRYESVDIADGYRTTLLDLNRDPVPTHFSGTFDIVLNVGTSEHVLDQAAVFRFMHEAAKPGGLMFHQLPATGFANHGYFCYTPRLFCDLAGYNNYEIVDLWFDGPSAHDNLFGAVKAYRHIHPALARVGHSEREAAIERTLIPDMSINVLYRRRGAAAFAGTLETSTSVGRIAPAMLDAYASGIVQRVARRTRAVLDRRFPSLIRRTRRLLTGR